MALPIDTWLAACRLYSRWRTWPRSARWLADQASTASAAGPGGGSLSRRPLARAMR